MATDQLSEITSAFRAIWPQHDAFTSSLANLLEVLLSGRQIEYFAVEKRTKTIESFDEKVHREEKQGKYTSYNDVTDLTGIRIINFLQEDCDATDQVIRSNFVVDDANSIKKDDELDPDKFGYLSRHYVLTLAENRTSLPEFERFRGLKAEVQVRTLLQHTWAAIDWKFRYKSEREAPKDLRRRLYRISALLEAADNEFSAVSDRVRALRAQYSHDISSGDLSIPLNTESILTFIKESPLARTIVRLAHEAGVSVGDAADDLAAETVRRLYVACMMLKLTDLNELSTQLTLAEPDAKRFFDLLAQAHLTSGEKVRYREAALIRYALLFNATPKLRRDILTHFRPPQSILNAFKVFRK